MKNTDQFSRRFLAVSLGLAMVLVAASLFLFTVQSTFASGNETSSTATYEEVLQTGTGENFIPLGISDGYAYWVIFNTQDGYKYRRTPTEGSHWSTRYE